MSLLTPDSGLLFWMLLSFGIVVFVLTKYGFPVILKMVEDRKAYIEESLLMAEKARIELQVVKTEGEQILANARKEHQAILAEAALLKEKLIKDARNAAQIEANKVITESRQLIHFEKEEALRDIRNQVAEISLNIAEKVMRNKLSESGEQQKMIERLLDEVTVPKS
jgi:F-type H+-transporting ATPase subunit b